MNRLKIHFTQILFVFILLALPAAHTSSRAAHTFSWRGEQFLLDGKPFQVISGEMHYARVPRPYWRRRMKLMKAWD
jgi:beta-galactosidase